MEEDIKEKTQEEKLSKSSLRPGGEGITITPLSPPPSPAYTTPLPRVSTPPPPVSPLPEIHPKEKKDITTFLLFLAIIFNIFSLLVLVTIGLDKTPAFLTKLF